MTEIWLDALGFRNGQVRPIVRVRGREEVRIERHLAFTCRAADNDNVESKIWMQTTIVDFRRNCQQEFEESEIDNQYQAIENCAHKNRESHVPLWQEKIYRMTSYTEPHLRLVYSNNRSEKNNHSSSTFNLGMDDILHVWIDMHKLAPKLWVLSCRNIRVPAHGNEDGVDT